MTRLLVTGATGLLGANLSLQAVADGWHVIPVFHTHRVEWPGVETVCVGDLLEPGVIETMVRDTRPDVLINAAAWANVDRCEGDPITATHMNRDLPARVADVCHAEGVRLIHISTDYVFDGARGHYREDDATGPISIYGETKLAGEAEVHDRCDDHCIVRTSLLFGWNLQPKQCFVERVIDLLQANQSVDAFVDQWASPLLVNHLAGVLLQIARTDFRGVLHVASRDTASRLELVRHVRDVFGGSDACIQQVQRGSLGLAAARPKNSSLATERTAQLLGAPLPTVRDGLDEMAQLSSTGWLTQFKSWY